MSQTPPAGHSICLLISACTVVCMSHDRQSLDKYRTGTSELISRNQLSKWQLAIRLVCLNVCICWMTGEAITAGFSVHVYRQNVVNPPTPHGWGWGGVLPMVNQLLYYIWYDSVHADKVPAQTSCMSSLTVVGLHAKNALAHHSYVCYTVSPYLYVLTIARPSIKASYTPRANLE